MSLNFNNFVDSLFFFFFLNKWGIENILWCELTFNTYHSHQFHKNNKCLFNQLQSAIRQSGGASDLKFSPVCLTSNWSSFLIGFFEEFRCHLSITLFANLEFSFKPQSGPKGRNIWGFFSSRSLKTREKYISFAQFVYFWGKCVYFSILSFKNWKVNTFPSKNIQTEQN